MNPNVTFDKAAVPTFDAIQLTKSFKARCNFLIWLYGFSSSTLNYLYNYSVLTNHNEFTVSATSAIKIFIKTFAYQLNLSLSLCTLMLIKPLSAIVAFLLLFFFFHKISVPVFSKFQFLCQSLWLSTNSLKFAFEVEKQAACRPHMNLL